MRYPPRHQPTLNAKPALGPPITEKTPKPGAQSWNACMVHLDIDARNGTSIKRMVQEGSVLKRKTVMIGSFEDSGPHRMVPGLKVRSLWLSRLLERLQRCH